MQDAKRRLHAIVGSQSFIRMKENELLRRGK